MVFYLIFYLSALDILVISVDFSFEFVMYFIYPKMKDLIDCFTYVSAQFWF